MHVAAVIPARYASSRFQGKPLAPLGGKPMVVHVMERAARARQVEAVMVATDDPRIAEAVVQWGGQAVLTDPGHATGTDRLAEVARNLAAEIVVNVQGDEPLIAPESIDAVIQCLRDYPDAQMATAFCLGTDPEAYHSPHVVKVVSDSRGRALYFSRAPIPHARDGRAVSFLQHIGLYAYRRDFLLRFASTPPTPLERLEALEQLRALEMGVSIHLVQVEGDSPHVDTPEDLAHVQRLLEERIP